LTAEPRSAYLLRGAARTDRLGQQQPEVTATERRESRRRVQIDRESQRIRVEGDRRLHVVHDVADRHLSHDRHLP
jgi:hypothetical protein